MMAWWGWLIIAYLAVVFLSAMVATLGYVYVAKTDKVAV